MFYSACMNITYNPITLTISVYVIIKKFLPCINFR